ncbi:DNA-directed RNA polymerase III subunit RPC10-like [Tropilaelaps mercedesae]|uniref:DNA-directed RNA polymerase subunit n=1 Tax=Tropilaelaps mercedesae TaxID=418985 RepID=A0A1V9Y3T2_9ACAR|nr:DNA-directed RNA polymerase III subunit RPC10-like [Tropilaelaps mercedesae]
MLLFCPRCANMLSAEEGSTSYKFMCSTCPYVHHIRQKIFKQTFPRLKPIDDILGSIAAWANVDSTEEACPKCEHPRAFFRQMQTRSADEPMTTFYKCCNMKCNHQWKE